MHICLGCLVEWASHTVQLHSIQLNSVFNQLACGLCFAGHSWYYRKPIDTALHVELYFYLFYDEQHFYKKSYCLGLQFFRRSIAATAKLSSLEDFYHRCNRGTPNPLFYNYNSFVTQLLLPPAQASCYPDVWFEIKIHSITFLSLYGIQY